MKKGYPCIDIGRIIAAVFVIAIHIYPFLQINPTMELIVTRTIGRLAVPFFFMVTSFFLFKDGYPTQEHIKKTIFSLLKWYGIAIVIYIPLMIYNHYFSQEHLVIAIIKDIFIDGTFYHLWYFPATIIGLIIVLLLIKYCFNYAWFIVIGLYVIGVFGDGYLSMISQIDIFHHFYTYLFQYMDYTRNGFFFAPLFIMLGAQIARQKYHFKHHLHIILLLLSLCMMIGESLILHTSYTLRHDAMYFGLPVVSYLLFSFLITFQGRRYISLKNISLWVYVIHPWMIVVVRMIGKWSGQMAFIENNFIQFLMVVLFSFCFGFIMNVLIKRKGNIDEKQHV